MYANILSAATQFLTPDLIAKIASALGLDSATTQKTAGAAVPAILSGLANLASSPEGARQLSNAIAEQPQNTLTNFADMIGGSARIVETGKSLLSSLLGGGALSALVSGVGKFAGISDGSSKSMLGMLAPMVLGILGREQREGGLNASGLAQMLTSQKDQFAAAMPASLSEQLNRSGFFDRIGAIPAATAGRVDTTYRPTRASAPVHATSTPASTASRWPYWVIPLAALAGLGWYLLSGDWTRREEATRTTEPAKTAMQPIQAKPVSSEPEIGRQLTEAINSLQTSLQGVRDAGSAAAALPKLREMSSQIDRLTDMVNQLPPDARTRLAGTVKDAHAKLKGAFEGTGSVADATPQLKSTLDALRSRIDALASGRIAYFSKAPDGSISLTAYFTRDVHNPAGERIGTLNDLLITPDGRIVAAIVGVGGFLGIGEKEIALPFSSIQASRRDNTWHIVIDANKETLKDAPGFDQAGERLRLNLPPKQ